MKNKKENKNKPSLIFVNLTYMACWTTQKIAMYSAFVIGIVTIFYLFICQS